MSRDRRAVFLDRDGVLNAVEVREGVPEPPRALESVALLPGVVEACAELRHAGLLLVAVTNQPDIARGTADATVVAAINDRIQAELGLDDVLTCPHDDVDGCGCRKPEPGLLLEAARRHGIDLTRSVMVGDRWRDIEAGQRAGCRTVLIDHAYHERRPEAPDHVATGLAAAVDWIQAAIGARAEATKE